MAARDYPRRRHGAVRSFAAVTYSQVDCSLMAQGSRGIALEIQQG